MTAGPEAENSEKGATKAKICNEVCARITYQIALTVAIVGTILLVIIVIQILLPYLSISKYQTTQCRCVNSTMTNDPYCMAVIAGTKKVCPQTNNTLLSPCLRVFVSFNDTRGRFQQALLHHNEYNVLKDKLCSYYAVNTFEWQNVMAARAFERKYGKINTFYTCLFDPNNFSHVISEHYHTKEQVMHMIMWPSIGIGLSMIIIFILYCAVGCQIWGGRITTVMWETNLKNLEYDAQMQRIQILRQKQARYRQDNRTQNYA